MVKLSRKGLRLSKMGKRTSNVYKKARRGMRKMRSRKRYNRLMRTGIYNKKTSYRKRNRGRVSRVKMAGKYKKKMYRKKSYAPKYRKIKNIITPKDYNSSTKFVVSSEYVNDKSFVEVVINQKTFKRSDYDVNVNNASSRILKQTCMEVPLKIFSDKKIDSIMDDDATDLRLIHHYTKYSVSKPNFNSMDEDGSQGVLLSFYQPFNLTTSVSGVLAKILSTRVADISSTIELLLAKCHILYLYEELDINNIMSYKIQQFSLAQFIRNDYNQALRHTDFKRFMSSHLNNGEIMVDYLTRIFDRNYSKNICYVAYKNPAYIPAQGNNVAQGPPFRVGLVDIDSYLYDQFGNRRVLNELSPQRLSELALLALTSIQGYLVGQGSTILAMYPNVGNVVLAQAALATSVGFDGYYTINELDNLEYAADSNPFLNYITEDRTNLCSRISDLRILTLYLTDIQKQEWLSFITGILAQTWIIKVLQFRVNNVVLDDVFKNRAMFNAFYLNYIKREVGLAYTFQSLEALVNFKLLSIKPIQNGHNYVYKPRSEPNLHLFYSPQYQAVRVKQEFSLDLKSLKAFLHRYNSDPESHTKYRLTPEALRLFQRLKLLGVSQQAGIKNIGLI